MLFNRHKALFTLGKAAFYGLTLAATIQASNGAYYDTLPKGVRMLALKQVRTGDIQSAFNRQQQEQPYFFRINLDSNSLEGFNEAAKNIFAQLKAISQEAYEEFSFGEYQAKGTADVKVNGAGLAYGLSNRLTLYGTFPWYDARVNLQIDRTKQNNHKEVARTLEAQGNTGQAQIISEIANQLPDVTGEVIQSVVVNGFNYQPLGNWQGEGMGDMELGAIYRLTNWDYAGLALSGGLVLPTGREDDPDILQDFGFGDGQTDAFVEFGGGYTLPFWTNMSFDSFVRYTYQFEHERVLRVPESSDYPYGSESLVFKEKLGNMWDWRTTANLQIRRWIGFSAGFLYNYIGLANYDSPNEFANQVHARETEIVQETVRLGAHFSTVPLYKSGDFFLPFNCNLTAQKIIGGQNTPKYSRYDVEFRFYF